MSEFLRLQARWKADAAIDPSTPVSSMLQKKADNTTQPYKRPFSGISSQWPMCDV
ncbi:MAG: hypothetical protein Q8K12_01165 [Thiobacillus sp.]|nr:hypothetical protein [Thiobacillus sp.]